MKKIEINRFLTRLAVLGALYFLVCFLVIALIRLQYPYELEWIEGGVLMHVQRLLEGKLLYVPPTVDFVPLIYNPLYFYVSAAISCLTGPDFLPLRAVSLAAATASIATIYLWVRGETNSNFTAVLSAGLFVATYRIGGAWLDLARVDSLYICLLLFAMYFLKFGTSPKSIVASSLLFALAFLTKQSALVALLPLSALAVIYNPKHGLLWIIVTAFSILAAVFLLDNIHDGWFVYYTFRIPGAHNWQWASLPEFWIQNLLLPLPLVLFLSLAHLYLCFREGRHRHGLEALLVIATLLGSALVTSLHTGSYDNVCLPAYAGFAMILGPSISRWLAPQTKSTSPSRLIVALHLGLLIQFGILVYNPLDQLPSTKDELAGDEIVQVVGRLGGEVFIPRHGYLAWKAGKNAYAHEMAIADVLRGDPSRGGKSLKAEIGQALKTGRWQAIIVDYEWLKKDLQMYYTRSEGTLKMAEDVFWPRTGMRTRPQDVYLRSN